MQKSSSSKEKETAETILKAKQAYYFGIPIMSDAQYDELEDELKKINPKNPILSLTGAPLPPKESKKGDILEKVEHQIHMGSQEKVNSFEELEKWERLRLNNKEEKLHASFKADGGSISLYYKNGKLVEAITRGDGTEGERITSSAALFQGVPIELKIPISIGVRAEAILTLEDWKKVDPFLKTNPRNVATGILGRLDGKKAHFVTALAFDLTSLSYEGDKNKELSEITTETEKSKFLEYLGFKTTPWKGSLTLQELKKFFEKTKTERESNSLNFWIDGVVVKYESLKKQEELGSSDNKPKGQVAWKFPSEKGESILEKVEWQVGHTGAITPVAHIKPIRIGGTTVSKASLANAENIKRLGAFIGAKVKVAKAGDIIPIILEVLEKFSPAKQHEFIKVPHLCPTCNSEVEKRKNVGGEESVVLFCPNYECESKIVGAIKRFSKSRDILGLGDAVITALSDSGIVTKVPDLYKLTPDIKDLLINEETADRKGSRLGEKRTKNILEEIQAKAKKMSLAEFLGAFGTRSLGVRRATLMIESNQELKSFEKWFDGSLLDEEFSSKAGVPKLGAIIQEGLKEKEEIIKETLKYVILEEAPVKNSSIKGTVCITGTLPSGKKKKEYSTHLEKIGYQLVEDVTEQLTYLVISDLNAPESSKTKKAKKLGVEIINEETLKKLLK